MFQVILIFFIQIIIHYIFQHYDGKCLIYDIMFYTQGPEQFDMGVNPTASAGPREDTQVNFYVL